MQVGGRLFLSAACNAVRLIAVLCACSELAHAQLPERKPDVIDFESALINVPRNGRLHGGEAISPVDPIAGYVEGVEFRPTGIRGGEIGELRGPSHINRYLHIEPQTDRHGLAIEFAGGGIFDLLSVDIGNYDEVGIRRPATVQFFAGANPPPFTPGVAENGWALATTPQPGQLDPYHRVGIAESTDSSFPAEQFRGLRRAYIGLDQMQAVDNIRAVWSRENFNNGAAVTVHQQTLIGSPITSNGLATIHQMPLLEATGNIDSIVRVSEERRIFTWRRPQTSINDLPLVIAGELDFHLIAEDGARASLTRDYELGEVNKQPAFSRSEGLAAVSFRQGDRNERSFDGMRVLESSSFLKPGVTYQLLTRLTVTLDPRGGYAAALMTDGWEVRLGGHLVPEPTGLILVAMAIWSAACCCDQRGFPRNSRSRYYSNWRHLEAD